MRVIAADCNRKRLSGVDRSAASFVPFNIRDACRNRLSRSFPTGFPHPVHSIPHPFPARLHSPAKGAKTVVLQRFPNLHTLPSTAAATPKPPIHPIRFPTRFPHVLTRIFITRICVCQQQPAPSAANPAVQFQTILHILSQVLSGRFQQGRTGLITTCVMARVPARRTAHAKPFIAAFPITFIMHFTMLIVQNHIRQSARPAKLSPNPSIPLPASLLPPPFHRFSTIPPHGLSPPPSGSHKPSAALTNQRFHTQPPPNTARRFAPYTTSVCAHFPHVFHISSMPVHTPLRQHKTPPSQSGKRGNFHGNVIRKRDGRSSAPSTKRNRQGQW